MPRDSPSGVPALDDEVLDAAVELRAVVVAAGAEREEVLRSLGHQTGAGPHGAEHCTVPSFHVTHTPRGIARSSLPEIQPASFLKNIQPLSHPVNATTTEGGRVGYTSTQAFKKKFHGPYQWILASLSFCPPPKLTIPANPPPTRSGPRGATNQWSQIFFRAQGVSTHPLTPGGDALLWFSFGGSKRVRPSRRKWREKPSGLRPTPGGLSAWDQATMHRSLRPCPPGTGLQCSSSFRSPRVVCRVRDIGPGSHMAGRRSPAGGSHQEIARVQFKSNSSPIPHDKRSDLPNPFFIHRPLGRGGGPLAERNSGDLRDYGWI